MNCVKYNALKKKKKKTEKETARSAFNVVCQHCIISPGSRYTVELDAGLETVEQNKIHVKPVQRKKKEQRKKHQQC